MFSPSISTIVSVSFSIISRFCDVVEDALDELDVDQRHVRSSWRDSWSFDRPNIMLGCRACQARVDATRRPRAGDAAADPRRGARRCWSSTAPAARARARWRSEAGVPLSLVHYHFGGKQGLLVAVLERENEELLERQRALYARARARWPRSGARPATSSTRTSARATCACCGSCGRRGWPTRSSRPAGGGRSAAGATCSTDVFAEWGRQLEPRAAAVAARDRVAGGRPVPGHRDRAAGRGERRGSAAPRGARRASAT